MFSPSLSAYELALEHIDSDIDSNNIILRTLRFLVPDDNLFNKQLEEHVRRIDEGVRVAHIVQTICDSATNLITEYDDLSEYNPNDTVRFTAEEAISRILKDAQRRMRGINVAASPVATNERDRSASVTITDSV